MNYDKGQEYAERVAYRIRRNVVVHHLLIDKGKCMILEAQRRYEDGQVVEQVFLTFPLELRCLFTESANTSDRDVKTPDANARSAWQNRLERYSDLDT